MYQIPPLEPRNVTPWEIPFEQRLADLRRAVQNGRKTVAYLYEKADAGTFRYRAYNMCQALQRSQRWTGAYFFEHELELLQPCLEWVQTAILVRFRWGPKLEVFLQALARAHIPTALDIDDLVFDVSHLAATASALNVDLDCAAPEYPLVDEWAAYIGRLNLSGKSCHSFITTNAFLGTRLEGTFGKPAQVIPNFLNEEQLAVSSSIWTAKQGCQSEPPFTIGYFSGTPSHANDFRVIVPELKELLETHPNIQLRVVGYMDLPESLRAVQQRGQIAQLPIQNFCELQRCIAEVDVNLIPLTQSEFTNCKSELKYFEAAIVGTISCASPTFVYRNLIHHGENGFLCEPGHWTATLEKLFRGDFDKSVITRGRYLALTQFCAERQLPAIESVLDQITRD
jgi:glycosyltransferase involved in cell wall biosynthesis